MSQLICDVTRVSDPPISSASKYFLSLCFDALFTAGKRLEDFPNAHFGYRAKARPVPKGLGTVGSANFADIRTGLHCKTGA